MALNSPHANMTWDKLNSVEDNFSHFAPDYRHLSGRRLWAERLLFSCPLPRVPRGGKTCSEVLPAHR